MNRQDAKPAKKHLKQKSFEKTTGFSKMALARAGVLKGFDLFFLGGLGVLAVIDLT
jgi:hypothetical protein